MEKSDLGRRKKEAPSSSLHCGRKKPPQPEERWFGWARRGGKGNLRLSFTKRGFRAGDTINRGTTNSGERKRGNGRGGGNLVSGIGGGKFPL